MKAVITADLIDSSNYGEEMLNLVINRLKQEFKMIAGEQAPNDFRIYRGDSLQGVVYRPSEALLLALRLKTAVNMLESDEKSPSSRAAAVSADLRIAIGVGSIEVERKNISESNGQAFRFSGLTLDEMKYESRKLRLKTPEENINQEFNVSLSFLDLTTERWSTASAEVIYYLLQDKKETEIAALLKISQSAVNQRKKAAGWDAIKVLLERYEKVISEKFDNGK
ncbi:hypothetical protein [Salegentibacter chungangensis]|uniref:Fumarate hydratase n=1 Tax=Salegentibacter chungangensis TaxID=1335724 RepID=A0ABW3NSX4_9FLAO